MITLRFALLMVTVVGCGKGGSNATTGSAGSSATASAGSSATGSAGSAATGSATGSAATGSATGSAGSGAGAAMGTLSLEPHEKLFVGSDKKGVEMVWEVPGGPKTVTVVHFRADLESDAFARLVVWGGGERVVVMAVKDACYLGAQLWKAPDGKIVFRCEARLDGEDVNSGDDWLIAWTAGKPVIENHWHGDRDEREPDWAASPLHLTGTHRAPIEKCCCAWSQEEDYLDMENKKRCEDKNDMNGKCVAKKKCKQKDE